ncbi:MAG: hypothetical protein LC793_20050 [Thermomicrobia bacterium]|nr:hypothetical protein [Thermomicrobia bacterium]
MIYELWYEDTGNIIDAYRDESNALAELRAFIKDHGSSSVETMVLLAAPEGCEKQVIAHGARLAELALAASPIRSQIAAM